MFYASKCLSPQLKGRLLSFSVAGNSGHSGLPKSSTAKAALPLMPDKTVKGPQQPNLSGEDSPS